MQPPCPRPWPAASPTVRCCRGYGRSCSGGPSIGRSATPGSSFDPPLGYARQLLKDMRAVEAFAGGLGLDLSVVRAAAERVDAYVAQGHAMDDSVSIIRLYRDDP